MKIPKIIHQTWKTSDIPYTVFRKRWVDSWREYNPEWEYKLWTDEDIRNLIKDDYPWFLPTYDGYPFHICRVDAARCFMMHKYGGLYVDLDFECLKSFDSLIDNQVVLGYYNFKVNLLSHSLPIFFIPNALMMSVPGHSFWKVTFDKMIESVDKFKSKVTGDPSELRGIEYSGWVHYLTGPILFSNAYKKYDEEYENDIFLAPPDYFYSFIPFEEFKNREVRFSFSESFDDVKKVISKDAYAVTYWTASWAYKDKKIQQLEETYKQLQIIKDIIG